MINLPWLYIRIWCLRVNPAASRSSAEYLVAPLCFNYTEFWFNHNSSTTLDVTIQVFTVSGKLVKTILGTTESFGNNSFSRDISWDGRDDFGDKVAKGVYIYKLNVRSESLNKSVSKIEKLVIL